MDSPGRASRNFLLALRILAVAYAVFAGLRTVGDFDLPWHLATARYMVEHKQLVHTDVFSYTAHGKEWIYPFGGELLLYGLYRAGRFTALSWLQAAACGGAVALLSASGGIVTALLAIVAVPTIAQRTVPRAELFTTVLLAAFAHLLWRHFRGARVRLWLLPLLMVAWVNLHLGFAGGLALVGGYLVLELSDMVFAARRPAARARLRQAAPWLALTVLATLLNPWGPRIYLALLRQGAAAKVSSMLVSEWTPVTLSAVRLREALAWRDPESGYWWLLAAAVLAAFLALRRRPIAVAPLLLVVLWYSTVHIRFQGLFAVVAVVVGGAVLADTFGSLSGPLQPALTRRRAPALALLLLAAILLAGVRVADLISNRYYLSSGQTVLFGSGPSWWYPERATDFLLRQQLPGNVFHDYTVGGYLTWSIGPRYQTFVDNRYIPFDLPLLFEQRRLLQTPPDSPAWQREADRWNINTLIFPVARYAGLGSFPLQTFCQSTSWRLVYLDEVAVIFVRNTPQNAALLTRLQLDCAAAPLSPSPALAAAAGRRARAELYNFYANAGSVLYVLGRDREAAAALDRAQQLFPDDPNLHLIRGQLFQANGLLAEAEREYKRSLKLRPTDLGWYALARLYSGQRRYAEAARAVESSAQLSRQPYERYRALGLVYLAMDQPQQALRAFEQADDSAPFQGEAAPFGAEFNAQVAEGRARAWRALGDVEQAIRLQEQAVKFTPESAGRWQQLADYYEVRGLGDKARDARQHAQAPKP